MLVLLELALHSAHGPTFKAGYHFAIVFNGFLGDQLSHNVLDRSSPHFQNWVQMINLTFLCSHSRDVAMATNFGANSAKLAYFHLSHFILKHIDLVYLAWWACLPNGLYVLLVFFSLFIFLLCF